MNLIELSIICRHQHSHLSHHMMKVSGTWMERFFRRVRYLSKLAGALSTSLLQDQRCSASNATSSSLVAWGKICQESIFCRQVLIQLLHVVHSYLYLSKELEYFVHRYTVAWKQQPMFANNIDWINEEKLLPFFNKKINEVKHLSTCSNDVQLEMPSHRVSWMILSMNLQEANFSWTYASPDTLDFLGPSCLRKP